MPAPCVIAALRPELLRSLKRTLEPEVEVVAMVDNPFSLQNSMGALAPDLAVVDVELFGPGPWRVASLLRRSSPGAFLIVLVDVVEPSDLEAANAAGIDLLLARSSVGTTLLPAVIEGVGR